MNLLEKAFRDVYPEKPLDFVPTIKYSGKFKGYRANIRKHNHSIIISMSKQWKGVAADIQIGLMQELLVKLFKQKKHTLSMDLYNNFIRHVHIAVPKTKTHPVLQESFRRVNRLHFDGMIEEPNLTISNGTNTLGTYEYGTDTIAISSHLLPHPHLLDYVMYHEMLHKQEKFTSKFGTHRHHTHRFRQQEHAYPNAELLEKELQRLVSHKKSFLQQLFAFSP